MSDFIPHLEEFRRRLIICLGVFLFAAATAYVFSHALLDFLTEPLRNFSDVTLVFQKPHEAFVTHLKVAAVAGLVLSAPVILAQTWLFVAPGLYPSEKKILLPLILVSGALFFIGVVFAYAVVIPFGLRFFLSFQTEELKAMLAVGPYFSFVAGMILAFGLLFDFPVAVVGLVRLGVVSTATLARLRKIIILVIFVVAAIFTPSPDPVSQLFLALPLALLFEASLLVARIWEKRT